MKRGRKKEIISEKEREERKINLSSRRKFLSRERERERERERRGQKRDSQVGDGITKPSTSAGMLTWCHNLDIEKGGATIWT